MTGEVALAYPNGDALQRRIDEKDGRLFSLLWASTQARITTYIALAKAIQDAGQLAVVLLPRKIRPSPDELVGFEEVEFARLTPARIADLRDVDLVFSSENRKVAAPRGASTVGIFHSLPDAYLKEHGFAADGASLIRAAPTIIRSLDYFVLAVRQREWNEEDYSFIQGVYPEPFLEGRRPSLDIVPAGYPKLDYSRRVLSEGEPHDHIVYCPTSTGSSVTRVREDGEIILTSLLDAFPEYRVVFRPYPGRKDRELGRAIAARFASEPRFLFDDTPTGIPYQRRCALAVTDSSSSAITFSIATERPLVFVDLGSDSTPDVSTRDRAALTQLPFGYSARTVPAFNEAVRSGIADARRWRKRIHRAASAYLYNPGTAAEYLAAHLDVFARGGSHPDWLSIPRRPWTPSGEEGEADRHLERLGDWSGRGRGTLNANQQVMHDEIALHFGTSSRVPETSKA